MKPSAASLPLARASAACGLLALSWLFLLPLYDRPIPWLGWLLVLAGAALLTPREAPARERSGRTRIAGLGLAVLVGLLLPMPYRAGFLMLAGGLFLSARPAPRTGAALQAAGLLFLLQGLCLVVYELVCSATPDLRLGSALAPLLSTLFGVEGSSHGGALYVGARKLQLVAVTPDSLGLLVPLLVAAPLWARGALRGRAVLCVGGYTVLRYAAVLAWCAEQPAHYAALLTPTAVALSYLPLLALLWALGGGTPAAGVGALRLRAGWYAAASIAAAALAYGVTGVDPGEDKEGRVLVDDAHGAWESGTAERSMDDFGTDSTYTYSGLWDWLRGRYPVEIKLDGDLTEEELARADVLVLKTPSRAYTQDERARIEAFVARGGGLLAVGDHTDVFGTTTVLNGVLAPFGLQLERDVGLLIHKRHIGDYRFRKDRFFANPLTYGIDAFDFMGPASVLVTEGSADHVLQCQAQVLEAADYRDTSFFGDRFVDLDDVVRPFYACVAKRHGAGRVVVWGDSTVFSNFSMFEVGKPEVVLSILSYLNKRNTQPEAWKPAARTTGVLLALGLFALYSRRRSPEALASLLAGGAAGLILAAAHGRCVQEASYRQPELDRGLTIIGYDVVHGDMCDDVPPGDGLAVEQRSRTNAFDSLFLAAMRIPGCFPQAVTDYDGLQDLDVLFLVDPGPLGPSEEQALLRAVGGGLKVVVAASEPTASSGASRLLAPHGMTLTAFPDRSLAIRTAEYLPRQIAALDTGLLAPVDAALCLAGWEKELSGASEPLAYGATVLGVAGGAALWTAGQHGIPVLARAPVGQGSIYAFASGGLFASETMGQGSSVILPCDPQMASYRAFEALLGQVLGGASPQGALAQGAAGGGHNHGHAGGAHAHGGGASHAPAESAGLPEGSAPAASGAPVEDRAQDCDEGEMSAPSMFAPSAEHGPLGPEALAADAAQALAPASGEVVRARVSVLLKNASQAVFGGGYVIETSAGDALRLALDPGTGALEQGAPRAAMIVTPDALALVPQGVEPIASRRGPAAALSSLLKLPASWTGEDWSQELVEDDPWRLVSRALRRKGLEDLGNDLLRADVQAGALPADGWEPLPQDQSYRVSRSLSVLPLGGEVVGDAEVWTGTSSGRPRKVKLTFRMLGDVSDVDWYDVLILYDDYQRHPGFPLDFDIEAARHGEAFRWIDLNEDVALAAALGR